MSMNGGGDVYGGGKERIGKDRWEVKKLLIIKLLRMIVGRPLLPSLFFSPMVN